MAVKWTEEQQKVIDLRDRNILVSAAAGSGKTAVLVERIISRITSEKHPADVDRMLIVTFTEAAAAEMKERIGAAVEKKLEEFPGDERLQRQATLIYSAPITTIHSFCLSVIRDHFHVIGADPSFRVAEEGELRLLRQDVMDGMLEEYYASGRQEFLDFVERFGAGKNDRKIEEIILKLYDYSRSYPQPEKWIGECAASYEAAGEEDPQEHRAVIQACWHVRRQAEEMERLIRRGLEICEESDGPYMYGDMLESDLNWAEKLVKGEKFEELRLTAENFAWKRLSGKKDDSVSPSKKEEVKKLRESAKKLLQDIRENYLFAPAGDLVRDMHSASPSMKMLAELVNRFSCLFSEKKKSRNVIDFSDMEQFALAILTEEKEGKLMPSRVASEYRKRFDEVMIDEYQDSNLVQETILTSVSGIPDGRYNIFMVGDVKQSIYSFRLSRPELFMEKYHSYTKEESRCQRVDLHKNFRSRGEVLDSVNYIFRKIMKESLGGIEYDDDAALYAGASFPEAEDGCPDEYCTELMILDSADTGDEDARRAEARMIAGRIRQLMESGRVVDKETGEYRKIRYRDIVILTRSIRGWAEDFTSVLAEEGIPSYSVSREGYFETYEVSLLLDYLKILDNARQDLPLAAVLSSCFGELNTEEMAEIRLAFPNEPFYSAAALYASQEPPGRSTDPVLRKKLEEFYRQVSFFRKRVPYTPIHELLEEIIEKTGYGIYISAMPAGAQREANVDMLVEKAASFEGSSYKGLFNFVRYIEQLKKYEVDYGEAGLMDEQADTVRVMSIHKSKGLEFPVVFAAGMGKHFNMQDTKSSVIIHPEWGVGLDDIDLKNRTKMATLLKRVIRRESVLETLGEEMRVLYVALTRAKEKLIITGAAAGEKLSSQAGAMLRPESASSCLDWILPAVLDKNEEGRVFIKAGAPLKLLAGGEDQKRNVTDKADLLALDVLTHWDADSEYSSGFSRCLREQMEYRYPFSEDGRMKLKFTVSELKKRTEPTEETGEEVYAEPDVVPMIPRFLQEEEELQGASRGSAYHKFLELLNFEKRYDIGEIRKVLDNFRESGRLSYEMARCIRPDDMVSFLGSKSAERMSAASRAGKLHREQPFVISVDAGTIYPDRPEGESILIQGIIDVWFEEDGGIVVLDYKTDRVRYADELREKYHSQLDYYAQALSRLTGRNVKEKIIYSFALREEIRV